MSDGPYEVRNGMVCKKPIHRKTETGTSISIGFPVCIMHNAAGADAAEVVAELMNRGERVPDLETALLAATDVAKRQCEKIEEMEMIVAQIQPPNDIGDNCTIELAVRCAELEIQALARAHDIVTLGLTIGRLEAERDARPVVRWVIGNDHGDHWLYWGHVRVGQVLPDGPTWCAHNWAGGLFNVKDFSTLEAAKSAVEEEALRGLSAKTEGS